MTDDGDKLDLRKVTATVYIIASKKHLKYLSDVQKIYQYKDGVYVEFTKDDLGTALQKAFDGYLSNHWVDEAYGIVKRRYKTILGPEDQNPRFISVQNGVIDLETMELLPHSPDSWVTNKLPITYDPSADCPAIKQFLSEVLRPEDIPLMQEIIGWTLWKYDYRPHKAVMLYGNGRNGKSVMLRIIEALHGENNVSHVALDVLCNHKFAAAQLVDKSVNLYSDLPAKDLSETSTFKCVTGEDTILVEEKYKTPFSYKNYAKLIFAANKLPKSPDDSDGFYSRWIIIEFPRQFSEDEQDKTLVDKLTTPEELSGLLNFALDGLRRLRANGWTFSYRRSLHDVRRMYQRLSDPVYAFLEDCCEHAPPENYITKAELFSVYKEYALLKGLKTYSHLKFSKLVEDNTLIPVDSGTIEHGTVKVWRGIRWKGKGYRGDPSSPLIPNEKGDRGDSFCLTLPSLEDKREEKEIDKIGHLGHPHDRGITSVAQEPAPASEAREDSTRGGNICEAPAELQNRDASTSSSETSDKSAAKLMINDTQNRAELNDAAQRVYKILREKGRASASELARATGHGIKQVRKALQELQERDLVIRERSSEPYGPDTWRVNAL